MKTMLRFVVRSATVASMLTLVLATSRVDAAGAPSHSLLFKPWINGVSAAEPQMQVQRYDGDTYVIRQSIRTNFEGPFLYLLFGSERALLIDSGAGGLKVRPTIDRVIADWSAVHHRTSVPLIVAHSHSHGDHHQGDAEFQDRPDTTVVGLFPKNVADFDSLGPYRLYIPMNEVKTYRDSIDRVAAFTRDKQVSWILGAHIELKTSPGELIPDEAPSHPDEHALEIPYGDLPELQTALHAMGDNLVQQAHRDFVIFPRPAREPQPFAPPASGP